MLKTTVSELVCPKKSKKSKCLCQGALTLFAEKTVTLAGANGKDGREDVWHGRLECGSCKASFPILAGVAVLVDDVRGYILHHVKGVSKVVPDSQIPKVFLSDYREVREEMKAFAQEHIDEDLESERVTTLYVMTHYLRTQSEWWKPLHGEGSPLLDQLIREYWDQGPFFEISKMVETLGKNISAVELGCGVGGLYSLLKKNLRSYLGVDNSFASVALARHLNLGTEYPAELQIPGDLLLESQTTEALQSIRKELQSSLKATDHVDFVVGEIDALPLKSEHWDLTLALNAIDMLEEPAMLPSAQFDCIRKGGHAIESCPYVWHPKVAKRLRHQIMRDPKAKTIQDSASAVQWLYQQAGFEIEKTMDQVPWLFFKQVRQLEIYAVNILCGKKT